MAFNIYSIFLGKFYRISIIENLVLRLNVSSIDLKKIHI